MRLNNNFENVYNSIIYQHNMMLIKQQQLNRQQNQEQSQNQNNDNFIHCSQSNSKTSLAKAIKQNNSSLNVSSLANSLQKEIKTLNELITKMFKIHSLQFTLYIKGILQAQLEETDIPFLFFIDNSYYANNSDNKQEQIKTDVFETAGNIINTSSPTKNSFTANIDLNILIIPNSNHKNSIKVLSYIKKAFKNAGGAIEPEKLADKDKNNIMFDILLTAEQTGDTPIDAANKIKSKFKTDILQNIIKLNTTIENTIKKLNLKKKRKVK